MPDPREVKLPKWAQEALSAERRRADLAWPTEARPDPLYEAVSEFMFKGDRPPDGTLAWIAGRHGPPIQIRFRQGHCYRPEAHSSESGSRPMQGAKFYATRKDALLASWWEACDSASKEIHAAATLFRNAE